MCLLDCPNEYACTLTPGFLKSNPCAQAPVVRDKVHTKREQPKVK